MLIARFFLEYRHVVRTGSVVDTRSYYGLGVSVTALTTDRLLSLREPKMHNSSVEL